MENKQKTVWLVEDDSDISMVLGDLLEFKEFIVHKFRTADDVVRAISALTSPSEKPDVIITDYNTPGEKNGFDVTKAAKDADIKSIIYTASGSETFKEDARRAEASAVFIKPYDNKQIVAKVNELVNAPNEQILIKR